MRLLLLILLSVLFPSLTNGQANRPWMFCAEENDVCIFTGKKDVFYGLLDQFPQSHGTFTNGVVCNNEIFGDPLVGIPKKCYYDDLLPIIISDPLSPSGNSEFCKIYGFLLQETSPAIGAGAEVEGYYCPAPGHPGDGECLEWFNLPGPDVGACQTIYLSKEISIELIL